MIPLFKVTTTEEEVGIVEDVLRSGFWAMGDQTRRFEEEFAKYLGVKHVVCTNSGTSAIFLALKSLQLPAGSEVITPSLTFVSAVHSILQNGLTPVFADVKEGDLTLDPEDVERKITGRTEVIFPCHLGGIGCDMKRLMKLAEEHGVTAVLEDAAHAAGGTYNGKKLGSFGLAAFSFYPTKPLAMPYGGAVATNDDEGARLVREWRRCGIKSGVRSTSYDVVDEGWNFQLPDVCSAIGLCKLKTLDRLNEERKKVAKIYWKELSCPRMPYSEEATFHVYWVRLPKRDEFIERMAAKGIESGIHYKPIHQFTYYRRLYPDVHLPVTERVGGEIVSIPCYNGLSEEDQHKIIEEVDHAAHSEPL